MPKKLFEVTIFGKKTTNSTNFLNFVCRHRERERSRSSGKRSKFCAFAAVVNESTFGAVVRSQTGGRLCCVTDSVLCCTSSTHTVSQLTSHNRHRHTKRGAPTQTVERQSSSGIHKRLTQRERERAQCVYKLHTTSLLSLCVTVYTCTNVTHAPATDTHCNTHTRQCTTHSERVYGYTFFHSLITSFSDSV